MCTVHVHDCIDILSVLQQSFQDKRWRADPPPPRPNRPTSGKSLKVDPPDAGSTKLHHMLHGCIQIYMMALYLMKQCIITYIGYRKKLTKER